MTGEEIDRISRDISEEGFRENFGHSLGHGVGLEVHENPGVGPNSKDEIIPRWCTQLNLEFTSMDGVE